MRFSRNFFQRRFFLSLALISCALAVYFPAFSYGFLHFDDHQYVSENPYVLAGFSWAGLKWAFMSWGVDNWIPLAWLSHMADVQFWGVNAGAHHGVNILLHAANSVLLFLIFERMTLRRFLSFAVALIFTIHPMHVESVAWISERKDVLAAFLMLITVWLYIGYVQDKKSWLGFFALFFYALALMTKPMAVSLPLILLTLDFWPLGKIQTRTDFWQKGIHKIPFFLLAFAIAFLTWKAQSEAGAVFSFREMPFVYRIQSALVAAGEYIYKFFIPMHQSIFYPPFSVQAIQNQAWFAGFIVLSWTAAAVFWMRRLRWVFSGWMIFIFSLAPVLGLVKAGDQAMADRYTYFAYVGLSILVLWDADEWIQRIPRLKKPLIFLIATWVLFLSYLSMVRIQEWRTTETLFKAAVRENPGNHVAYKVLADDAYARGDLQASADYLALGLKVLSAEAEAARPEYELNLAVVSQQLGLFDQAAELYQKAITRSPLRADLWMALGDMHMQMKLPGQARLDYEHALQVSPGNQDLLERLSRAKSSAN